MRGLGRRIVAPTGIGPTGIAPAGIAWARVLRAAVAVAAVAWVVVAVLLVRREIAVDMTGTLRDAATGQIAIGAAVGLLIGALALGWGPLALVVWVAVRLWRLGHAVRGTPLPRRPRLAFTLVGVLAAWTVIGGLILSAAIHDNLQGDFFDQDTGAWQWDGVMGLFDTIVILGFIPSVAVAVLIRLGGVLDRKLGTE